QLPDWPADLPDFDGSSFSSGAEPPVVDSSPPEDPPLSADSADSLFFGGSGSGLGVSTFVSIVISSGSSLACFFALAKNSSAACVGSAGATAGASAGASATTCPPGAASCGAMARPEATTAAVAARGRVNADLISSSRSVRRRENRSPSCSVLNVCPQSCSSSSSHSVPSTRSRRGRTQRSTAGAKMLQVIGSLSADSLIKELLQMQC